MNPTLIERLRSSAKAFRENTVYDSEGGPLRLIVQADECDEAATRITALEAEKAELVEVAIDCAASLNAAISLLERGGKSAKKAAPSDKIFDLMVADYKASLERARATLTKARQSEGEVK